MTSADLPEPLKYWIDAVNRSDTQSFLAFFSSNGIVNDWSTKYLGPGAIRAWSDREFLAAKVTLAITSSEQKSRRITVAVNVGGDGFNDPSLFTLLLGGYEA